jgi:hypothetical protein
MVTAMSYSRLVRQQRCLRVDSVEKLISEFDAFIREIVPDHVEVAFSVTGTVDLPHYSTVSAACR